MMLFIVLVRVNEHPVLLSERTVVLGLMLVLLLFYIIIVGVCCRGKITG